jgi:hypothetical protein
VDVTDRSRDASAAIAERPSMPTHLVAQSVTAIVLFSQLRLPAANGEAAMKRTLSLLIIGFASLQLIGCGFSEAAPPQAPSKEIPKDVEPRTTPPEPGHTRVILDANGEKATVTEVVEATSTIGTANVEGSTATVHGYSETTKPICVAPCVADLKPGMHVLRFTSTVDDRQSSADVQVGDRSKVVRHAMGRTEGFSLGNFGATMLVVLGASALGTGALIHGAEIGMGKREPDDLKAPGAIIGSAGLGAVLIGIPLMILSRPVHQPGATTEMALAR